MYSCECRAGYTGDRCETSEIVLVLSDEFILSRSLLFFVTESTTEAPTTPEATAFGPTTEEPTTQSTFSVFILCHNFLS